MTTAHPAGLEAAQHLRCPSPTAHRRDASIVNEEIIAANFAMWIFYELPDLGSSIYHASFYPCTVSGTTRGRESWDVSWVTVADGGGTAFFAHVGGFVFGYAVAQGLSTSGALAPGGRTASAGV